MAEERRTGIDFSGIGNDIVNIGNDVVDWGKEFGEDFKGQLPAIQGDLIVFGECLLGILGGDAAKCAAYVLLSHSTFFLIFLRVSPTLSRNSLRCI